MSTVVSLQSIISSGEYSAAMASIYMQCRPCFPAISPRCRRTYCHILHTFSLLASPQFSIICSPISFFIFSKGQQRSIANECRNTGYIGYYTTLHKLNFISRCLHDTYFAMIILYYAHTASFFTPRDEATFYYIPFDILYRTSSPIIFMQQYWAYICYGRDYISSNAERYCRWWIKLPHGSYYAHYTYFKLLAGPFLAGTCQHALLLVISYAFYCHISYACSKLSCHLPASITSARLMPPHIWQSPTAYAITTRRFVSCYSWCTYYAFTSNVMHVLAGSAALLRA